MVVDRGVETAETTVKNVVVVEERKEWECGGEMDKRCFRKKRDYCVERAMVSKCLSAKN